MTTTSMPVIVLTSSDVRPADSRLGQIVYETDTKNFYILEARADGGRVWVTLEEHFDIDTSALEDEAVTTAKIEDGAVTGAKMVASFLHVALLTGQNGGSDATYEVSGAAVGDEVVFVGHFSTAASIASLADVTGDFSFTGDDELTDGGPTDYSDDQLMLIWIDKT